MITVLKLIGGITVIVLIFLAIFTVVDAIAAIFQVLAIILPIGILAYAVIRTITNIITTIRSIGNYHVK